MPREALRVGIVGCGSAGPAAALFLARAGHQVDVFEQAPSLGPVGTGFILQPTGLDVLEDLGLREATETFGARLSQLQAYTLGGKRILDLAYQRLGPNVHGVGMHRATFLEQLVSAFPDAGVRLHLGAEVTDSAVRDSKRTLTVNGEETGPYDLVILCNGARSKERDWLGTPQRARRYPWGAFWAIVPDREGLFREGLHQVVDGTREMLGLLPTGCRHDDPDAIPLVSLFWSVRVDRQEDTRAAGHERLAARIRRLEPRAAPIVESLTDIEEWSFAEYMDVVMPRWHADSLVVLGDAAHATSPQLGQGVNLALWDARELDLALQQSDSVAEALADYSRRRRRHLSFYQHATRWLTPFFQSDVPGAGMLRDLALPLAGRIPYIDRQMLSTMSGLKTGIFSTLRLARLEP